MSENFGGWLFQCNPMAFRIFRAVEEGAPIDNWSANQHRGEMSEGDRAALWISAGQAGYQAGVYGVGKIRSKVWAGDVDHRYWQGQVPEPDRFIDIAFDRWIFHHPISVDELKSDPDFRDARILRMPRATNFVLSTEQWNAIERRVAKRRPTASPTLTRNISSFNR